MSAPALSGDFEILERLGVGGLAEVHRARLRDGSLVAVKRLHQKWQAIRRVVEMFNTEAEIGTRLVHPNIVRTLGTTFDQQHQLCIVMEYVPGRTLAELLQLLGPDRLLAPEVALFIASEVCAALHFAHELKSQSGAPLSLIHRDVSPENIVVSFDGIVKLSDFGGARVADLKEGRSFFGKLPYLAPEQVLDKKQDRRVDVYATGVLLFELLTGRHPFTSQGRLDEAELSRRITKGKFPTPRKVLRGVPEVVEEIVLSAMATKPKHRHPTTLALRNELQLLYRAEAHWAPVLAGLMRQLFPVPYAEHLRAAGLAS